MTAFDPHVDALRAALDVLAEGFASLPAVAEAPLEPRAREALLAAARRMRDNYPYHHPLYVGQMLKPPHPVARLAYAMAMTLNPNNHALDGGRASSRMEKEVIGELAAMLGWAAPGRQPGRHHLGHLCGGGTLANFEALWVAREEQRAAGQVGAAVVASAQAHYTHARLCAVLDVPFRAIATDARGRLCPAALEDALAAGGVGTVVATLGATATGAVDPLDDILALRERHRFRLHVDAAYGGYFTLAAGLGAEARRAFDAIGAADSFAVDPHKHGLQPYGCGAVLFRDPAVGRHYRHDSPYTYFTGDELHLGEISLECSRAGAAAVALWTTMQALPTVAGGEFAGMLDDCLRAARRLHRHLTDHARWVPLFEPQLDIVVWAVRAETATEASALAQRVFERAAARDLHLAVVRMPRALCEAAAPVRRWEQATDLVCLRACAMKPEHAAWMGEICTRLDAALEDAS